MLQDIRYAMRAFMKEPGFTVVAILTIALGIGATTTIVSIANTLFTRMPPGVRHPESLVTVAGLEPGGTITTPSYPALRDHRDAPGGPKRKRKSSALTRIGLAYLRAQERQWSKPARALAGLGLVGARPGEGVGS